MHGVLLPLARILSHAGRFLKRVIKVMAGRLVPQRIEHLKIGDRRHIDAQYLGRFGNGNAVARGKTIITRIQWGKVRVKAEWP
ncbi:hypothetical protein V2G26_019267 [Clonostachys chloroleuca]